MRTKIQLIHACPKDAAGLARLIESALTNARWQAWPGVAECSPGVCNRELLFSH